MFILIQYFDGGYMSIDTNSMSSVLLDAQINNMQQQQKQDAINYLVHELKVSIVNLLDEVEKIEQKVNLITNGGG